MNEELDFEQVAKIKVIGVGGGVKLSASGYYFNEVTGELSKGTLALNAVANLQNAAVKYSAVYSCSQVFHHCSALQRSCRISSSMFRF